MKYIYFLSVLFLLVSCMQNHSNKNEKANIEIDVETTANPEVISAKDTKLQIKSKLQKAARHINQEFGELILFDEYFYDNITKYYIKDKDDEQRNITVVIYNDRCRYMKILLQHVGNTSPENINMHFNRIKAALEKAIESNIYTIVDKNYLKVVENEEIWYSTWIVTISKKTGTQDYWNLNVPEEDYNYLKYMVKTFSKMEGFKLNFIVSQ